MVLSRLVCVFSGSTNLDAPGPFVWFFSRSSLLVVGAKISLRRRCRFTVFPFSGDDRGASDLVVPDVSAHTSVLLTPNVEVALPQLARPHPHSHRLLDCRLSPQSVELLMFRDSPRTAFESFVFALLHSLSGVLAAPHISPHPIDPP